jgi:hypothetical protein
MARLVLHSQLEVGCSAVGRGGLVRALAIKTGVLVLGLVMFAAMSRTASADSFSLDGASLDSFTLGSGNSFTVSMPLSILAGWLAVDQPLGFTIPNLFLEDQTTGTIYDFKGDLVTSDGLWFWGYFPEFTATISYATVTTPEAATPLLLVLGIFALAVASKKLRTLNVPALASKSA